MRTVSAVLCIVMVSGCGPTKRFDQDLQGREKPAPIWLRTDVSHVRHVIPAYVEAVWRVLPASFEALRFPGIPTLYPEDHVYVSPQLKIERRLYENESNSRYLDCGHAVGGLPAADEYQVIFNITARLTPAPDGETEIDIIVDGTAQDMKERFLPVRCAGTGRLEDAIIDQVLANLRLPSR